VKHLSKTSKGLPAQAISSDESYLNWCIFKCSPDCKNPFSRECWECMWGCLMGVVGGIPGEIIIIP